MSKKTEATTALKTYSAATRAVAPALPLWLKSRAAKGKEDPARLGERKGIASLPRPEGTVYWMHAASVGESQMLIPLIKKILRDFDGSHIIITTGTVTSADMLADTLPERAMHQYAPLDHPKAVKNFLDHWQPDAAIFAESELWPNMIMLTKQRDVPMALVNARMSAASIERWGKRSRKSGRVLLGSFDVILAADKTTADGLTWLTGREIESAGNLKDAAPALPVDDAELKLYKKAIGRRQVWCAASTHEGEEELLVDTINTVQAARPKSLLILAPRHPERADEVCDILEAAGFNIARVSKAELPTASTDILVMDQMGKMGMVYRLSHIAFVGGSLIKGMAGHNPLEPARLNCAVITGSHISSFADTYMAMMAHDGVTRVLSPKDLGPALVRLFKDKDARAAQSEKALQYAQSRDDVLAFVWQQLAVIFEGREK